MFVIYPAEESEGAIDDLTWDGNTSRPAEPVDSAVLEAIREERTAQGDQAPRTFENQDVDWELVDPRFKRVPGDGAWPRPNGHSHYQSDPAFLYALAIVRERRGAHVP